MKSTAKVLWFARGGGIARCGPFKSQVAAVDAMRLVKKVNGSEFPPDIFVWPEAPNATTRTQKGSGGDR